MQAFKVYFEEVEGRLDVPFYKPELLELEKKIKLISEAKLGDFILNIAGGSTPSTKNKQKYYTDNNDNGVPFIRVQNLTSEGVLNLEKTRYVNLETHNGLLKRSKVKEGNLLIKITGVGRMAISSVAPKNFEGNINQHIAVIDTGSKERSEIIATFLNSNIGESLASRRATGGTRPALDYEALKSIPIVLKPELVQIMKNAYQQKNKKEQEAKELLDSIDGYLLKELGVKIPNIKKQMTYIVYSDEFECDRFDPFYHSIISRSFRKPESKFDLKGISDLVTEVKTGLPIRKDKRQQEGLYPYYGANGIIGKMNNFTHDGEYLIVGQDGYIGNHYVVKGKFWASNHTWVAKFKEGLNIDYIKHVLDVWNYDYLVTGGVIPKLTKEAFLSIKLPIPPLTQQNEIVKKLKKIILKAESLQQEAKAHLQQAKQQVEEMIFQ